MKKYITLTQWDEITKEQKNILWNSGFKRDWQISISDMIEFLGDDFECIEVDGKDWIVFIKYHPFAKQTEFESKVLVDCLWESCKYKLKEL